MRGQKFLPLDFPLDELPIGTFIKTDRNDHSPTYVVTRDRTWNLLIGEKQSANGKPDLGNETAIIIEDPKQTVYFAGPRKNIM